MNIKNPLTLEDFKRMKDLEEKYYGKDFITPYEEAYRWYKTYEYTIRAVEIKGEVVGFINLFPINDRVYKLLKEGRFNDKYLEVKDLIDIENNSGEEINLFLSCVLIDEKYRKTKALTLILREYMNFYQGVNEKIQIKNVITDNVTGKGEGFSKRLGFKKVKSSDHNSVIYEISFENFVENIKKRR